MTPEAGPGVAAEISVVIPTLGRPLLESCLRSIAAGERRPARVIVVDQGAAAEAPGWMDELRIQGLMIDRLRSSQRGRASAVNRGLERVATPFVAITDDDCTVAGDWVMRAEERLAREPATVLTGAVLAPEGEEPLIVVTSREPAIYRRPRLGFDRLSGGNMAASLAVFERVGLLHEDPRLRCAEDGEWAYRALRAGVPIRYCPELRVWHHDWRDRDQRAAQYVAYARSHGAFYGEYIRAGDAFIVARALAHHARALRRWIRARTSGDRERARLAASYLRHLLPGIVLGLGISRRSWPTLPPKSGSGVRE